jgi:glycosyltransferase involved in cell wall biosynthesis
VKLTLMKVAIVHDYLSQFGGAERVVSEMARIFRDAPIYTSIFHPEMTWPEFNHYRVFTSWLQNVPGSKRYFKLLLPLYPIVFEQMYFENYDVVISSASSFAKGINVSPDVIHICYCHAPTRFLWSFDDYLNRQGIGTWSRNFLRPVIDALQHWDLRAARKPDYFLANSSVVKQRIARIYGRDAQVIHPPVNVHRFEVAHKSENFYLIVSRLLSYKRIDIAIEAFNRLGLPLVIVGDGPDRGYLERLAKSNVTFTGYLNDTKVLDYFYRCRAFVFPGEEDFGIAPLEANACGKPVIAYRAGGTLDTVINGESGLFFDEQNAESLVNAVQDSQKVAWDPDGIRIHAESFCPENFQQKMVNFVGEVARKKASLEQRR